MAAPKKKLMPKGETVMKETPRHERSESKRERFAEGEMKRGKVKAKKGC